VSAPTDQPTQVVRDRRQLERALEIPLPSDALPQYGGHGYTPAENAVAFAAPSADVEVVPLQIDAVAGVVLEANDLAATRDFYNVIFGDGQGEWRDDGRTLTFETARERVAFVRKPRPRTVAHAGLHTAFRVKPGRVREIADALAAAGRTVSWWREDHPSEREVTAYLEDPSGNIIQLVRADDESALVDHYYVPVEDIEHGELFYLKALRGQLDSYYGYTTEDTKEARRWAKGDDPCAPWTRNAFISFRTHQPNPTPAAQIFARFGDQYLGISLSGKRLSEPPEDLLKGTPRPILRTSQSVDEVAGYLATVRISPVSLKYDGGKVPFRRDGQSVFLRDRSGNFFEIACGR
jgi:catechol 2,3-dioxygenase-like lactoylglutathione lyase family enzyme